MSVLEVQNLTHVFPDGTIAIQDISIRISSGEFVIVAGANGSGKTVFVRHLNGLLVPTRGSVRLNGEPILKNITLARKKIGFIFQDSDSQIVGQTVAEDVAFGPENLGLKRAEVDEIVSKSLAAVGMEDMANQSAHGLSGGQKKRLAIAGVLAMQPDILIFDEPFTGLDYPGVVAVLRQLVALHQTGHTIILVTHELEKVLAHADRLVIIHEGRLAEDGRPEDVIRNVQKYGVRMPLKGRAGIEELTWLK